MAASDPPNIRVPLVEEQVEIGKRQVETDRVRVRTIVDTQDVLVDEMLRTGSLHVRRVAVEREVAEAPAPYQDGDTLVIPVIEERLVVEKRLFVVEEVHVTGTSHEQAVTIPVSLRRMRAVIERDDPDQVQTGSER